MIRPRPAAAAIVVLAALATLAARWPGLGLRPMHCDEAVHALKFEQLWHGGDYRYDPHEYHGPALYYLTLPVVWLAGVQDFGQLQEWMLRLVPLLCAAGGVALLALLIDGLGAGAAVWAALFLAASPALTFYSRYYIQESLLVFFTAALLACGWRYYRSRRPVWALLAGVALGLMHATKETFVIALGAMLAALVLLLWPRRATAPAQRPGRHVVRWPLIAGGLLAISVSAALYSNLLRHPQGILDSVLTYREYFTRAGAGGDHEQPWYYYLKLLTWTRYGHGPLWSEGLLLGLGLLGAVVALLRRHPSGHQALPRFLALYTLLLIAVYSLIPYKTPWCALSFLYGLALLAGMAVAAGLARLRRRWTQVALGLLVVAGLGHLAAQAQRACSRRWCADYHNPYVYAQPTFRVVELAGRIEELAALHPDRQAMRVNVIAPDYWPLPWYLRRLSAVGWYEQLPEQPDAPVVVVDSSLLERFVAAAEDEYQINAYGLRQPSTVLWLCVERGLWQCYVDQVLQSPPDGAERAP